ncbi:hypothetical protein Cgig2_021046 [Carnegiea gigantea]|uniref:monodehydroascorbate reductase (NADH) n=1 Tax=Carnegiea gigantea TaxID=171969 RepID=A0A9Q1Q4Q5_9CARY|nr:hypothetical protein Cgig2_021046 [Carnegiea gigantea]
MVLSRLFVVVYHAQALAFSSQLFGEIRRLEHVDSARKTARHAVASIMEPEKTDDFDYLPFFYSSLWTLLQFYGDNAGELVHYGDYSGRALVHIGQDGQLVGSFLEGGTKEDYEALAKASRLKPSVELRRFGDSGFEVLYEICQKLSSSSSPPLACRQFLLRLMRSQYMLGHATAGVILAASIAAFAYWYGRRRRRWVRHLIDLILYMSITFYPRVVTPFRLEYL